MKKVCVYFYANNIYNLGDMSILDILPDSQQKTLYKHLDIIKQKFFIQFAIINFNQPLREILYSLFPGILVIINPKDVLEMINFHLGYNSNQEEIQEEVAVTVENKKLLTQEMPIGCQGIYSYHTKQEAMSYYREWQSDVPLGIKSFHHVIRKIDFYYDEVFNYFVFKNSCS